MIEYYADHELVDLWRCLDEHMYLPEWSQKVFLARILLCTGNRILETVQIQLQDCHENHIWLRVCKGGRERPVEWFPLFLPYYQDYLSRLGRDSGPLFPAVRRTGRGRNYLAVRTGRKWWQDVAQLAGLRYLGPHGLRRTFVTWGTELLSVQDMKDQIGHRDIRTTEQHYRGSIVGRRFKKDPPAWQIVAQKGAEKLTAARKRSHLHVVGG
jgi:integrase